MENQHINYFKIENFKKFDSLEVSDIGQFNLIVGDNNSGKTCLLEALILNSKLNENLGILTTLIKSKNPLFESIKMKKGEIDLNYRENIFAKNLNNIDKVFQLIYKKNNNPLEICYKVEHKKIKFSQIKDVELKEFIKKTAEEYSDIDLLSENWLFAYLNKKIIYIVDITSKFYNNFIDREWNLPLIQMRDSFDSKLLIEYFLLTGTQENKILLLLNKIFPDLKLTRIRANDYDIQVITENRDDYHSITQYGGGILRMIKFIVEILRTVDNRLMIDEIEIGIHHTKMKQVWKIILELCEDKKIQLFATTHSKECSEAFADAIKDLNLKEKGRLISLQQEKNKIKAYTYTIDNLDFDYEYRA